MVATRAKLLLVFLASAHGASTSEDDAATANPIRRVVKMLQKMQKKVSDEGKKEEELYDKFMCYCKHGVGELEETIDAAGNKIPQIESSLKESEALKVQLGEEIAQHKADRNDAKEAIAKAEGIRTKEAAAFAKESADYKTNIGAMSKAVAAIAKGASGSFLQSKNAKTVARLAIDAEMSNADRDILSGFLSMGQSSGYVPQSGQVTGILKQMLSTMQGDLDEITKAEDKAISDFKSVVSAKTKEINANQQALESKMGRQGEVGVEIETLKADLDDTGRALIEDKKYLADLSKGCETKEAEYSERVKTRAAELVALGDTIKILNDDDALELFKKTLPAPTLLQVAANAKVVKAQALKSLSGNLADPRLKLIALALKGRTKGFEKVLKMIDSMVALLGQEQIDDESKKSYCEGALDKTEDKLKTLMETKSDLETTIEEAKGTIETLADEVKALTKGIKDMDSAVEEATSNRQEENAEYKELMSSNTAAKEILALAKNRLAKFYAPKLYKPPPKKELSAAARIEADMGGAAVLVQVVSHTSVHRKDAPAPPPETWGAYQKKGEEHAGVIQMIDMLAADLDKEMQEAKVEEENSQSEYEEFMDDSTKKRAADAKSIQEKTATSSGLASDVEKMKLEVKSTLKEAAVKSETLGDLHNECDWLLANFDARKEARSGEIDSLKKAKAVLSGADFALVQASRRAGLRGAVMRD